MSGQGTDRVSGQGTDRESGQGTDRESGQGTDRESGSATAGAPEPGVDGGLGPRRSPLTVRDLYPGYFALVMATGIVSTALHDTGHPHLSGVLLGVAIGAFAVLCLALAVRAIRYRDRLAADLRTPERGFAFFTFVAGSVLLGVRLNLDHHLVAALILVAAGSLAWLALGYTLPVLLILGARNRPPFGGVNGTWFIWVVGTQALAVAAAVGDARTTGYTRPTALAAVLLWSVGVILYLIIATLVLARLLSLRVRAGDLTSPYWVTMGATAITVLAAAQILTMAPSHAGAATRQVVAGLGVMLWAFGTWLIPLLVVFALWRRPERAADPGQALTPESQTPRRRDRGYDPAWWSIVFPLGMYATASMRLGRAAQLPIVAGIGRAWTWLAVAAWLVVFVAMVITLLRAVVRRGRGTAARAD